LYIRTQILTHPSQLISNRSNSEMFHGEFSEESNSGTSRAAISDKPVSEIPRCGVLCQFELPRYLISWILTFAEFQLPIASVTISLNGQRSKLPNSFLPFGAGPDPSWIDSSLNVHKKHALYPFTPFSRLGFVILGHFKASWPLDVQSMHIP